MTLRIGLVLQLFVAAAKKKPSKTQTVGDKSTALLILTCTATALASTCSFFFYLAKTRRGKAAIALCTLLTMATLDTGSIFE